MVRLATTRGLSSPWPPSTRRVIECDIKLELAREFYERREEVWEGCVELVREPVQVHLLTCMLGGGGFKGDGLGNGMVHEELAITHENVCAM